MGTRIEKQYYNSHGSFTTVKELYDLEVLDRENYTHDEVQKIFWRSGLEFNKNFKCIWVTSDKKIAESYRDDLSLDVVEVNTSKGVVLFEFDDGDNGFLYVEAEPKLINIRRGNFINWFFSDEEITVATTKSDLMSDLIGLGECIISAQDLLDNCGYIPKAIVENPQDYPDYEVSGSECLMKLTFDYYIEKNNNDGRDNSNQ